MHRIPSSCRVILLGSVAILTGWPSLAAEGRTPIWQPTVITAPGKYVVTRNIAASPGAPVIDVSAPDVDLDLNGMELLQPAATLPVIVVSAPSEVRIHGGVLRGGSNAILAGPGRRMVVEGLRVADTSSAGLLLSDVDNQVIRDNLVFNVAGAGIRLDGSAPKTGTIDDNVIRRTNGGIEVQGGTSLAILHNRVEEGAFGPGLPRGIVLDGCTGMLVADNTVQDVPGAGIAILRSGGHTVDNNVIRRAASSGLFIDALAHDILLRGNVVSGSGAGSGIVVNSSRNVLEANLSNSNLSFGFELGGGSSSNVYRHNVARGNGGGGGPCAVVFTPDFCDSGAGNSSAGDNFLPAPGM